MFDVDVANQVGVIAAILFQNIAFWCQHSRANGKNFFDGRYWTFNTNKALCELFPYLTSKMIRTAMLRLVDDGLIITGNYNKLAYDRTTWYALTEKGESIFLKSKKDLPSGANGIDREGEPIPDINTDINTDNNISSNDVFSQSFTEFWNVYPRHDAKQDAVKAWKALKPSEELCATITADIKRRLSADGSWYKAERKYIPLPATYIRGKRWEDEPQGQTVAPVEEKEEPLHWSQLPFKERMRLQEEFDEREREEGILEKMWGK